MARAYPRIAGLLREHLWMFFDVLIPLLSTVGFVYFYKSLGAPPQYVGFVVLGGASASFWLNVLWSMATQLFWEKESGNLAMYIMAPTTRIAVLMGMAVGGLLATLARAAVILVVCSIGFGVQYDLANLPLVLAVFVLSLAGLYALGMTMASLYLFFTREAFQVSQALQEPIYVLSGLYFPVRTLGLGVAAVASLLPLTLGLDAMRQLLFAGSSVTGFLPPPTEIGLLALLFVVFLQLSRVALSYMELLGKREGRLTARGQ